MGLRLALRLALLLVLLPAAPARALEFRHQPASPSSPFQGMTLLLASGPILPGDGERFRERLRALADQRVVLLLDSPGGSVSAAAEMAGQVARRRMMVAVPRDAVCASACFLVLAAGSPRVASETARLGVHSAAQDRQETLGSLAVTTALARELHRYGVPERIIGTLVTTPPNRMAWLTEAERASLNLLSWEGLLAAAQPGATQPGAAMRPVAMVQPAPARRPASPLDILAAGESRAFREGLADRTAWEDWLAGASDSVRAGAEYWAARRGLPSPGDCSIGMAGVNAQEFAAGCQAARRRLTTADLRRRTEPDYARGWNSFLPAAYRQDALEGMAACRERGGTPLRQPGFETVRDLNGDGRPDYLIDFRALRCRQPGGGATTGGDRCGEAGDCALHVYVSMPAGGHARTNAFMARGWSLPAGAPATLLVQEGDCADEACARRHVWDGAAFAGPAPQNGR